MFLRRVGGGPLGVTSKVDDLGAVDPHHRRPHRVEAADVQFDVVPRVGDDDSGRDDALTVAVAVQNWISPLVCRRNVQSGLFTPPVVMP